MLAGIGFYHAFVALVAQYNTHGIEVAYSIQTNGTFIDKAWAEFFVQQHFLVGLSIDGTQENHDSFRVDKAGKGTYTTCMQTANLLTEAGADFNVLSVVTKSFAEHPDEAWQFYKQNKFHFIQLIPCMDALEDVHGANEYSLDAESYGRFLCRFFDLWYEDFIKGEYISVRAFDNWVRMLMGQPPENCGMTGCCSAYPVIEADGSVYPCDFYVLDDCKLGTVQENTFAEMLTGENAVRFMTPSHQVHKDCAGCQYGFLCRGGCRCDRGVMPDGTLAVNRYCEGYKMFFAHAMSRMMDIAKKMPQ